MGFLRRFHLIVLFQILLKAPAVLSDLTRRIDTDETVMPRFVRVTRYVCLIFGIAENKAEFVGVASEPLARRRGLELLVRKLGHSRCEKVDAESRLMLRVSRASGIGLDEGDSLVEG